MKKYLAAVLVVLLAVLPLVACGGSKPAGELNLYTWEGMFPEEVLSDFTKETGIKINYSNFDFSETMLAKLEADKSGMYDLVIADDYIVKTAIEAGLVQKLDKSKLDNFSNINPLYQSQFFDPANEYTVPYGAGVQTILYDPALLDIEIKGYEDLWNPALQDKLGIIGNYRVIDGAVLKTMGESYNTEDLGILEKAGEKLLELAPNVRVIRDDNLQNDLISGEIAVGIMYTSQVTLAKMARPDLKVVFPEEGIGFGIMANFIPANAKNESNAHAFINYILKPEVAAKCFEYIGYYTTNLASEEFISPEMKDMLTLPENFSGDMEMIQPVSPEAEEAHSKIWTEFKTGR